MKNSANLAECVAALGLHGRVEKVVAHRAERVHGVGSGAVIGDEIIAVQP